ncbi:MAG: DNA-3-methyladenine glycosylase 2 family protein [Ectothiorhodospiraceae bacterium]|nr:DNA-3-methyladenine glycosylase 2 family protein [Ectothiorhodospiraceae bacterium]MCH8505768.1 DNA-3-methyladenine glycosylase [Ectothiorhodospiraceae bacterium]
MSDDYTFVPRLSLAFTPPLAWDAATAFLTSRGADSTEQLIDGIYVRALRTEQASGWVALRPGPAPGMLELDASQSLLESGPEVKIRVRRLLNLDADTAAIDDHLGADPLLAPLVQQTPGLRVPGTTDGFELAIRAILGQQVTVKAATTLFRRFVAAFGAPVSTPFPALDHTGPDADRVRQAPLQQIIDLGLTSRRAQTVLHLANAVATGDIQLTPAADPVLAREQLQALPGIGPWTAHYIAMRALADPDAFPSADLGLMRACGIDKPAALQRRAEAWRPWRAYAAMHCWHALSSGG